MTNSIILFKKALDKISNLFMLIAGLCLLFMVVLINVEVTGRYIFNYSTLISDEYGGYLFSILVMLGLVYSLHRGQFLRVTSLVNRFPDSVQKPVYLVACLLGFVFSLIVTIQVARVPLVSLEFGSRSLGSETPLFFPQLFLPIGMAMVSLEFLSQALNTLLSVLKTDVMDAPEQEA